MIDLRQGRYQDTLSDVTCDALIVDAPYSARTHKGHAAAVGRLGVPNDIGYGYWTPETVAEFVQFWHPRVRSWFVTITDHVLGRSWEDALQASGRYVFPPVPWINPAMSCRKSGDGPASSTCHIVVARPKEKRFLGWGSLPGWYNVAGAKSSVVVGAKPTALMEALVRDYSRPGDIVCDPCAGGGTTLLAASKLGRDAIGSEMDAETHHKASVRLGLRAPTAEDAAWLYKRGGEDKGTEGLPMFTCAESPTVAE